MVPGGSGANVEYTNGIAFSTGIAITTTTGLADNEARLAPLLARLQRDGGDWSFDFYMETKNISLARGTHAIPKLGA